MKIDFNMVEEKRIPSFKGGEGDFIARITFDGSNKILKGKLEPGSTIGYHKHDTSSETIFILSGVAKFITDEGEESLTAGECHYCAKGHSHSMINEGNEDLIFFATPLSIKIVSLLVSCL